MTEWLLSTFRNNIEIPLFLCIFIGYSLGNLKFKGISVGDVTATLLAALVIGQIGISVSPEIKTIFFAIYLFAVGYSAGPQFVRGLFSGGLQQALFAVLTCVLSLGGAYAVALLAGYDPGTAAGLFAGSATSSASMPLSETAIAQSALSAAAKEHATKILPAAFTISFVIGTLCSVMMLGILGPRLLKIDLAAACRDYVKRIGGEVTAHGSAWHQYIARAYRIDPDAPLAGLTVAQAEHFFKGHRLFIGRIRRGGAIMEATAATVLEAGDVVCISGSRHVLLQEIYRILPEVDDPELVSVPVEGTDILVTTRELQKKTLEELADLPEARGIFLTAIHRGAMSLSIPVLPDTRLYRGDIVSVLGRPADINAAAKKFGYIDRETERADVAFIAIAIAIGALIGTLTLEIGPVPLTLSTAGGVLLMGLFLGWLRSVHPAFGRVPRATVWFMNSIGLNLFVAVIGLTAAPGLVSALQELGLAFVLWSAATAVVPMLLTIYMGKYLFRFDDAILFGCCAGARKSSAALNMITERAESQVPAIGYSVGYAVSSTVLMLFGLVIVALM